MSQASSISNPLSGSITTPTATLGLRFTSAFTRASSPGSTETRAALVSLVIAAAAHGENFVSLAVRLWQNELLRVSPPLMSPAPAPRLLFGSRYPWHSVTSSVFNIRETATQGDPGNCSSAWIHDWVGAYGGVDSLSARRGFLPAGFIPRLNPF